MAMSPVALAQSKFLMNGGGYELAMAQMRERGTMPESYVYHEYPKAIRVSHGFEAAGQDRETETCKGTTVRWTDQPREIIETIIVNSEAEEERVLAGGKTTAQIEDERLGLINRCHAMSIPVDPGWSVVRLRRELGDALDAPAPGDDMARLEAELAALHKMAAMRSEIAALRAQLPEPGSEPLFAAPRSDSSPDAPIEELGDKVRKGKAS
jgi:hypothetical protein